MAKPRKWYVVEEFGATTPEPDDLAELVIRAQNSHKCLEMDLGEGGGRAILLPSGKFLIIEGPEVR